MLIPMKELNAKIPDLKSERTSIYYLNDSLLIKRFNRLNDIEKRDKLKRFEYIDTFSQIDGLSLPVDILETEKSFCGYVENILPGFLEGNLTDFSDYYNSNRESMTLEVITSYILKCCDIVAECHKNDIVIPDMASVGNVLFDKVNKMVYFTDYQDMQVKDISTNAQSSFIVIDPVINDSKYQNGSFYSKNIDLYTLAIRYVYYATKINLPAYMHYKYGDLDYLLYQSGLADTYFGECIRVLYNKDKDNLDIREAIVDLNEKYEISKWEKGKSRVFIKK